MNSTDKTLALKSETAAVEPRKQVRAPAGRMAMFTALRHRNFRLYWIALVSSILARMLHHVAQSWLVLELTNSPLMLGVVSLSNALPASLLMMFGGAIADRADRKRLFLATEAIMACFYFVIATLITTGVIQVWHIIVFGFLAGCVRAIDQPTRQAILPQVIPREHLVNAVALANTVWQLAHLVGPAIAGMLIYLYGVGSTFYVGGVGFLVTVALVFAIHVNPAAPLKSKRGFLGQMLEGLDFIRTHEIFRSFIALSVFNGIFGMSYIILMPVFARDILEVGSRGFGFLQATGGAGSVLGALTVAYLAHSGKKGLQTIIGASAFGLLLIGFGFSTWYPLSLGLIFLVGWANDLYLTTIGSVLQLHLPDHLRGRVMAIYGLTWSLMPLGGMIAGAVAEVAGAPVAVAICGSLVMAMALALPIAVPRIRQLD